MITVVVVLCLKKGCCVVVLGYDIKVLRSKLYRNSQFSDNRGLLPAARQVYQDFNKSKLGGGMGCLYFVGIGLTGLVRLKFSGL